MELYLDTQDACFMCLQSIFTDNDFKLRNVLSYLKISASTILKNAGETNLDPVDFNDKYEFSVKLCTVCQGLVTELERLVREKDLMSMLISYNVQTVNRILEAATTKETITDSGENKREAEKCMALLRQEFKDKCCQKKNQLMASSLPKVQLEKLDKPLGTNRVIHKSNQGNQSISNNLLFLDTAKTCFICLEQEEGLFLKTFDLRCIFRYMGVITTKCVPQRKCMKNLETNQSKTVAMASWNHFCDLSVKLCPDCGVVVTELDSQIRQVEIVLMLLTYHLRYLYEILLASQTKNANHLSANEDWGLIQTLRQKLVEKCCINLAQVHKEKVPKVPLNRFKLVKVDTKPIKAGGNQSDQNRTPEILASLTEKIFKCETDFKTFVRQAYEKYFTKINDGKQVRCLICKTNLDCKGSNTHFVSRHPEKLFEHRKFPVPLTVQQLACRVQNILKVERDQSRRVPGSEARECHYCNLIVSHSQHFRYHFITSLFSILEEKLQLQKTCTFPTFKLSRSSAKLRKNYLKRKYPEKLHRCSDCQVIIRSNRKMNHLVNFHVEKLFMAQKLEGISAKHFIACCKYILADELNQAKRTSRDEGIKSKCSICHYCKQSFGKKQSLRYHLATKHFDKLTETLVKVQQSDCPILDAIESARIPRNRVQQPIMPQLVKCNNAGAMERETADDFSFCIDTVKTERVVTVCYE